MKVKLFVFFGLALAAASLAAAFATTPAHAAGEKYEWINANTIKATEWNVDGISFTKEFNFTKNGTTYQLVDPGSCNGTVTIAVNPGNTSGALTVNTDDRTCQEALKDLDKNITIANPEKGPFVDGSEVNYVTVNCTEYYEGGENVARCQAIKSCVVEKGKNANECLTAWNICITNYPDDKQKCIDAVTDGDLAAATAGPEAEEGSTCAIVGIGWVICPTVTFLAQIIDAAYGGVSLLLAVQPLVVSGGTEGVYTAWSLMRNFANVAFVIAFLLIIFSQLTSVGITNYGIKKMLPRIIVSAILVNLSFWICAAAIDLSNIAGTSIYQVFKSVQAELVLPNVGDLNATGAPGWAGITTVILAGGIATGAVLYIGLSALLPAIVGAILTILVIFLVLTLRQALIILLVVVAPLAFVARLLPNTEPVYGKWFDLGKILLVMYPAIGFIFGASALASTIVMGSAPDGPYKIAIQIMGAAISILPMIIVPTFIKTTQGVLGRFGSAIESKGPGGSLMKKAEGYRDYRQNVLKGNALSGKGGVGAGRFKRAYRRDLRNQAADSAAKSAQAQFGVTDAKSAGYVAANTQSQAQVNAINAANSTRFVSGVASNSGLVSQGMNPAAAGDSEVAKALASQQQKAIAEAIKDVELSAEIAPGDVADMGKRLADAIRNNDSITARAMQNMLLRSGGPGSEQYRKTMQNDVSDEAMNSETMADMKRNLLSNHSGVKETAVDLMKHASAPQGTTMNDISSRAGTWSMSDSDLVHQKSHSLAEAEKAGGISVAQANAIKGDQQLYRQLDDKGKVVIDRIAGSASSGTP